MQRRVFKMREMIQDGEREGLLRYLNYLRGRGVSLCEIFPEMIEANGGPTKFLIESGLSRPTVSKLMQARPGLSPNTIRRTMAVFGMVPGHKPKVSS